MQNSLGFRRVLVLAPHTDDAELGAGGTIARLSQEGAQIVSVAFSDCRESVPAGFPADILRTEVVQAHQCLGVSDVRVLDYQVRYFPRDRQQILESIVALNKELDPDLVLVPMRSDIHQDHEVVCREGIRGCKHATIWGYELPWNNLELSNQSFVEISPDHLEQKVSALAEYASQGFRPYTNRETLAGLAHLRGLQGGYPLAETFEVIRQRYGL